jgi:hypothetical protein
MSKNFSPSFVISIGCGPDQAPLIKAAQSLGLKVLGVDREHGRGLVDELILESTYDTATVLEKLSRRKESKHVKGVLCRSSACAVVTADAVACSLSLPRCGSSVAQSSLSKSILCETSNQLEIPTIPILALRDLDSTAVSFRCVVKPDIPKIGKKNVFLVDRNTLHAALIAAEADSLNSKAIIQPFVEGEDIIAFVAFQFGKVIWYDLFSEKNTFVSTKVDHSGLAALSDEKYSDLEARLIPIAVGFARSSRASGFVSFSFRIDNNGNCFLYEVNPGLCGDAIAEQFLPSRWQADFFKIDVAIMIGSTVPKINRKT